VAVLRRNRAGDGGARLGGIDRGAYLLQQIAQFLELVALERPDDEAQRRLGSAAVNLVDVNESLAAVRGFGGTRHVRQGVDHLRRQVQRVDHLVLRLARMGGYALDRYLSEVGGEGLVDHFTSLRAVE